MTKHLNIQKTYKLYINGKFPRTESGRYFPVHDGDGKLVANICRASRKDFREAVKAARNSASGWSSRTAYNRGQILYRTAEILEGRKERFLEELVTMGMKKKNAEKEVATSLDRLVYYAGWTDKYQQIFSSVNPVSSSHYNFSVPEYQGIIAMIAPETNPLLGLVSLISPAIASGNTVVCLGAQQSPLSSISFAEVLHASDVPAGVVNILTGFSSELSGHFSSHMDVNGIVCCQDHADLIKSIQKNAAENVKRVHYYNETNWMDLQSPYFILDHTEIKTTWHPVGS